MLTALGLAPAHLPALVRLPVASHLAQRDRIRSAQQLVQKREEERAEAAALESKATKRLANMASIAASKSMRSMPGLAR